MIAGRVLNGTYRITGPLARGGMGAIYAAEHARLAGKRYAIKMLHRVFASSEEMFQRFRREAEIASQLGHEHIVEVHDFDVTPEGEAYMVMEYLAGEDLAARIARGALPLGDVVRIVDQIASALGAAHAAGIVHRDLKPQNVFLIERGGRNDFIKVLDFGISKVRDAQSLITREQAVLGTPFYMSPEQAMGQGRDVDPRTDVFSLGAIIWEMLTGEIAFASDTIPGALYKVVHVQPRPVHELRADLPAAVTEVLSRAMAKDRAVRTASVQHLAAELAQVAQRATPWPTASVAAAPASAEVRNTPTTMSSSVGQVAPAAARRTRMMPFAGAVLGPVVVAAAVFAWLARGSSAPPPRPAAVAATASPSAPASAPAPAARPATPLVSMVALRFEVRPRGVNAAIRIDGEPLRGLEVVRVLDTAPAHVVATARDHVTWEADVTPDRDRVITIELIPQPRAKPARARRPNAAPQPPAVPRAEVPAAPPPPPATAPSPPPAPAPAAPPPRKKSGTIFDQ